MKKIDWKKIGKFVVGVIDVLFATFLFLLLVGEAVIAFVENPIATIVCLFILAWGFYVGKRACEKAFDNVSKSNKEQLNRGSNNE